MVHWPGETGRGLLAIGKFEGSIPMAETMRAVQHSSAEQNVLYTELDKEVHAKRYCAMASKTVDHVITFLLNEYYVYCVI